jgi:signal transduction histidine kinase
MRPPGHMSIRARLTVFFVISIAGVLVFTGVALVNLVHRSLVTSASNQIEDSIAEAQARFGISPLATSGVSMLAMDGDVVVQVTNRSGTQVWAASSAIADAPVLARAAIDFSARTGLTISFVRTTATNGLLPEISNGQAQKISTSRGPGYIFGFVYGKPIAHSEAALLSSVIVSFPLLLLLSGGLIWMGIGYVLAPVEAIRRRVDVIAARDLSERVPETGGDDEIARMAKTVNEMLDRLESSSKFQQEFVSNASHELRSPLTTLLATVERARSDPANANWSEVTDTIVREGRRLDGLIDDLFWLARNDENQVETIVVDVDLDDLLFEEAQRIRSSGELVVDTSTVTPTRVSGDPALLKRMIRNVVDNAARYAQSELRFDSHYDGSFAVVTVADDGVGIDVESSSRFFDRFVRADSARSRRSGGTGLGLAIVTDIVLRHGGSARFVEVPAGSKVELRVLRDATRP